MLNQATFARGNDTFHYAWWLKLYDTAACEALLRTGTLYDHCNGGLFIRAEARVKALRMRLC